MRTQEINFFTKFTNYFTPTGRRANTAINRMREVNPYSTLYQRRIAGNIAIIQDHYDRNFQAFQQTRNETFVFLNKDGSNYIKETYNTTHFPTPNTPGRKLHATVKALFEKSGQKIREIQKNVLYSFPEGKIEEIAQKTSEQDWISELKVISAADRQSEFPATPLAGTLHNIMAKKIVLQNGDTVYIERYPQI